MGRLASDKCSSFLGPFVSYKENEGLWIQPQALKLAKRQLTKWHSIKWQFNQNPFIDVKLIEGSPHSVTLLSCQPCCKNWQNVIHPNVIQPNDDWSIFKICHIDVRLSGVLSHLSCQPDLQLAKHHSSKCHSTKWQKILSFFTLTKCFCYCIVLKNDTIAVCFPFHFHFH